jgi:hypothetical protein
MPAVCFTKPGTPDTLSFEDAPAWYDENTEVPEEAIRCLIEHEGDPRRLGLNLSPSTLYDRNTCSRQLLLKKFFPYAIDGAAEWQAEEGTIWHKAFDSVVPKVEDRWHREMLLPDDLLPLIGAAAWAKLIDEDKIRLWHYTPHHQSWEVQIFPGIWINGRVDKLEKNLTEIQDFKTKAWSGWKDRKTNSHKIRHYPPGQGEGIQLGAYSRMVEVVTGTRPTKEIIRQMYRGSRIAKESWKKYELDQMANDELEAKIRPHVERFVGWATEMKSLKDDAETSGKNPLPVLSAYLDRVPLDGEKMFNCLKCSLYCTQMPICFKLANKVRFETSMDECRVIGDLT